MAKQTQLFKSDMDEEIEEEYEDFEEQCDSFIDDQEDELENVNNAVKQMITTFYSPKIGSSDEYIRLSQDSNIGVEKLDSKSYLSKESRTTIIKISTQHLLQLLSAMDIYRKTESIEDWIVLKTIPNKNVPNFPMLVIESDDCRGYIVPRVD